MGEYIHLLKFLPDDCEAKKRMMYVLSALSFVENAKPEELLRMFLKDGIFPNEDVEEDVKTMVWMMEESAYRKKYFIPESAFFPATLLLLLSYLVGSYPEIIFLSPQGTINFKINSKTLIISDEEELGFFDHGTEPSSYEIFPYSEILKVLEKFFCVEIKEWQIVLFEFLILADRK